MKLWMVVLVWIVNLVMTLMVAEFREQAEYLPAWVNLELANFKNFHAMTVGFYGDVSDDGVYESFGNDWEITAKLFKPFDGSKPMDIYKEYLLDFFTDFHFVLKGASPF